MQVSVPIITQGRAGPDFVGDNQPNQGSLLSPWGKSMKVETAGEDVGRRKSVESLDCSSCGGRCTNVLGGGLCVECILEAVNGGVWVVENRGFSDFYHFPGCIFPEHDFRGQVARQRRPA